MSHEEIELAKKMLIRLSPLDKGPVGDLMRRYLRWKKMKLDVNSYGIRLTFDLIVTADIDMDVKKIVNSIVDELKIKKNNNEFLVNSLSMEYSVHKDTERIEV